MLDSVTEAKQIYVAEQDCLLI